MPSGSSKNHKRPNPSSMPSYVEGGFVNDQTGKATAKVRQSLSRPSSPPTATRKLLGR